MYVNQKILKYAALKLDYTNEVYSLAMAKPAGAFSSYYSECMYTMYTVKQNTVTVNIPDCLTAC